MAKKIKKVETPIDQRETFVSLQKNFADSELSVEEKLRVLYDLQKADVAIDKILQLRGELPEEVEALENEVADLKAKVAQETEVIDRFNKSIAANKQNIIDLDEEIAKYQEQLNNISNSREFDSINKEIENQGYLRQISEKNINDSKMAIANKKAAIEDIKHVIAMRTEDLMAKRQERQDHERLRPHPQERAQPPCRGLRLQRRFLRRMLQHHHSPASPGDRFQPEAHHLRALRTHHRKRRLRIIPAGHA